MTKMQNRFKFRLWDKEQKKFLKTLSQGDNIDFWISLDDTGVYLVGRENSTDKTYFNDITKDVVVQCCTGLKDKNGKLIYEGDILEILHSGNKKAVVCWNKTNACYELQGEAVAYNAHITIRNDYFEIVGNIYENPELMEENNDR